ncbi:MAG: hypothetical protein JNL21_19535 [Myxococcales bacterium]|nr:hypothetical protein [Myxococcales bacterium]
MTTLRSLPFALLMTLAACADAPLASHPAAVTSSSTPAVSATLVAPPVPQSVPFATPWQSFDALPPGATARLGSHEFFGGRAAVAITNDGTLWLPDDADGFVAVDAAGRRRIVDSRPCGTDPREIVAVGDEVRVMCVEEILHVSERGVARHPMPMQAHTCAWAPDGTSLACVVDIPGTSHPGTCSACTESDKKLMLLDANGVVQWELPGNYDDVRDVHVGRGGAVVLRTGKTTRMVQGGKLVWSSAEGSESANWLGVVADGDEIVSFHDADRRWRRRAVATGRELARSPEQPYSVAREIRAVPGSRHVFVALDHSDDSPPFGTHRRALVHPDTGRIVQQWKGLPYEWCNAVSPDGKLAAAVWGSFLLRVALDGSRTERTANHVRPRYLATSPAGDRLAVVGQDADEEQLVIYEVATGKQLARSAAPQFSAHVAFSGDGSRVAVTSKFGEMIVADGANGAKICSGENAAGSWIRWHGQRLMTLYPGDNGDDCDEITPASVALLDASCRVVKRHEVHGVLEILEETPARLVVAAARWKHECGDGFELLPAEAWAIDTRTGAKTVLPAEIARKHDAKLRAQEEAELRGDDESEAADARIRRSLDGKTFVRLAHDSAASGTFVRCFDATTRAVLATYALPRSAGFAVEIAPGGEWIAVADAASVLLYPCRVPGPK